MIYPHVNKLSPFQKLKSSDVVLVVLVLCVTLFSYLFKEAIKLSYLNIVFSSLRETVLYKSSLDA